MRVAIDTATLAVFDPARLRHRLTDPADWWTWPPSVLPELNAGNVLAFHLGSDGVYSISIHLDEDRPTIDTSPTVKGLVGCDSGTLFIGPGEQISGGGVEPDQSFGGLFLPIASGVYRVHVAMPGAGELEVWLEEVGESPTNRFEGFPHL
jgi:hypothetical protein